MGTLVDENISGIIVDWMGGAPELAAYIDIQKRLQALLTARNRSESFESFSKT